MARPATAAVRLLTGEREPVRLATTANITLYGLQTIDAVAAEVGDRVLVKNQADQTQNGIYTASEGQWSRAADARTARTLQKGTTVHVQSGALMGSKVFCFQTDEPVIDTSPISITLYLSENTLGDAQTAATNAAASATAAAGSATAASTSATNAANSATAANTSKSNAATSETNAGNSATAAASSATSASTSATTAGNSATAAATSATNAGNSATAASGSASTASAAATNAGNSATAAAASATAAANAAQAMPYVYSTTTADADPGNGIFRLNNATIGSATIAYIDNQDSDGTGQTGNLDTFDDSTNTIKGKLTIRSKTTAATKHVFNVTGSVVDGTGYRKLTLTYVGGAGALANAEACWLEFARTGDKGADGAGTGDFSGPASSVTDNLVSFAGTTGKTGKDSGLAAGSVATGPASATSGNLPSFNGTGGKVLQDSGVAVSNVALKASSNTFATSQQITLTGAQAIGVSGGPALGTYGLMVNAPNNAGAAAFITLQRSGNYAGNLGLDTDNALKWGGWSMGANAYRIFHEGLSGAIPYAALASAAIASNSEFQLGTASKLLTAAALKSTVAYQTLTSGASVSWDMSLGNNASLAAGTNVTIGNPSNAIPQFGFVLKITAVTSARTVSLSANLVPAAGVESFPLTVQTTEIVFLVGFVDTTSRLVITSILRT
ncbi:hypothetical protein AB6802_09615 [Mesorhizobium sp. RCC_202]|uniref:hypothetical protein n=1 Tax=Mesorhizobium sp. RCC_202 TaxID=3239222 RepID=UPI003526AC32